MLQLTEKDIVALSKGFAERPTAAEGRFVFGLRQPNRLKAAINWAQDFRRIGREVILDPTAIGQVELDFRSRQLANRL